MAMQFLDCERPYRLVKARHGWFLANPQDAYVGRAITAYGEYGESEWQFLKELLRPGLDAVEVGANIGSHTVPMAKKLAATGRRVLAVEPQPVIFQNMCANLTLNGLFNVLTENVACSDRSGWLSFDAPDYRQGNNFGGVSMREDEGGSVAVRAAALDDLVPGNFEVGLIKIDVEGFEQKVLEGAAKLIARHRPVLYLENDRLEKSKALIEWLWRADYRVAWHVPLLFNPDNFVHRQENIYPNLGSFNMLAVPKGTPLPDGLAPVTDPDFHPLNPVAG